MKTIYEVLKQSKIGDTLTNGKFKWTVVEHTRNGGDCVIAVPVKATKKTARFEIWGDAQSKLTYMKNFKNLGKVK